MSKKFRSTISGKKRLASLTMAALWSCQLLAAVPGWAAPTGGAVASGNAVINQVGNVTDINQSSTKAAINWQGFSIGANETVNFNQPGASSVTLNRVVGNESSVINGALNANGQVFLVNSNGVLFGQGSSVNTGGFVASTLGISDEDFNAGKYIFKGGSTSGSVINMGTITAKDGGYVGLLGNSVSNQGVITATKGTVALASGSAITLNFNGDSMVSVTVDEGVLNALVENKQAIYADGGTVILTAKAAEDLLSAQVNNSGIIQAQSIDDLKGTITLKADGGTANVDGTLDASAPTSGKGGFIETSGDSVKVADSATITTLSANGKTGAWLIDPDGFTIGTNAADGDMTAAAITKALTLNSVTIASTQGKGADGNINVNGAVSWSANTLTLNATNNIYVNAAMTATGTASFAANYGHVLDGSGNPTTTVSGTGNSDGTPYGLYTLQSGSYGSFLGKVNFSGTGAVMMNGDAYTVITSSAGLAAVASNLNGKYVLGSDFSWNSTGWTGAIGASSPFTGVFNGFGHLINSYAPTAAMGPSGLFGTIGKEATVSNMGMGLPSTPNSSNYVAVLGLLANYNQGSIINTCISSGSYDSATNAGIGGGLVGDNSGLIAQSGFSGNIYATNIAGNIAGVNESSGRILDSWSYAASYNLKSLAAATGVTYVGGLVGVNNGTIRRSFTNSGLRLLDSNSLAGIFVGKNTGTIDQCYSNSDGSQYTFGYGPHLAGFVYDNSGTITNSYTTTLSNPSSSMVWDAGFVYLNSGTISNAYTQVYSGNTTTAARYGFVYDNTGTLKNDYWYAVVSASNATTGVATGTAPTDSSSATALTSAQAATFASYTGFDTSIWGNSYSGAPILRNTLLELANNATITYGSVTSDPTTLSITGFGFQGFDDITGQTTTSPTITVVTDNGYVDAGTWTASSLLSSVYTNVKGLVTVTPKTLTVSGVVADKTYDGTTAGTIASGATNAGLDGLVEFQTLNIDYTSAIFGNKTVGTGKAVTLTYTVADGTKGGKASNYTIATTTTGNIVPKTITAIATATDKVYDGTTSDTASLQLSGVLTGETVTAAAGYTTFADANAGTNKAVNVSGITLGGADIGNYVLGSTTAQTTASITPRSLNLTGYKEADGTSSVSASALTAMNVVGTDSVTLSGTPVLASSASGVQKIANLTSLTVNNPNYTLVGAVGSVVVGGNNRVLDHVASGTVDSINTFGSTTTITTSTEKTIIDWLRFNIAPNETVSFTQPGVSSVVLNRVTGSEASVIAGNLTSNGRVFIINSNGILFAANSSVNVGGLVASALAVTDDNFLAGNYVFTATSSKNSVIAEGDIIIADGGFVALASNSGVTSLGKITARGGKALLASVDSLTLTLNTTGLASYALSNLDGVTLAGGSVDLAAISGTGGLLETAGWNVVTTDNFVLSTGTNGAWSLSMPAITIGTGGTFSAAFVNNNLAKRSLYFNALNDDLTLNGAVTWSTDATLGLSAKKNININNAVTATGTNAGLVMNYGGDYKILTKASYSGTTTDSNGYPVAQVDPHDPANGGDGVYGSITLSGSNASLKINGNQYTLIHSMSELDAIDKADSTTGMYYNPLTGQYDTPMNTPPVTATVANSTTNNMLNSRNAISGTRYYNPATGSYNIAKTKVTGGVTSYYNPETGQYDLSAAYSGNLNKYYYNPTTGKYDTACYDKTSQTYYDPSTQTYHLTAAYAGTIYYYNLATEKFDITSYDTASGTYYDPSTQTYHLTSAYLGTYYYYNSVTKKYDIANYNPTTATYYDPTTRGYTSSTAISVSSLYYDPATGYYDCTSVYAASGYYALAGNLDAVGMGTTYTGALISSFSGTFTGLGHTISNLTINGPSSNYVALIGQTTGTTNAIRDIGVVNANIVGSALCAPLVSIFTGGTISNVYATGHVSVAHNGGGGLVYSITSTTLNNAYADVSVTSGDTYAGGLIGCAYNSTITNAHATGSVTVTGGDYSGVADANGNAGGTLIDYAGGLVAYLMGASSVSCSYATGAVSDIHGRYVGGLIGRAYGFMFTTKPIPVTNCFATGAVTGLGFVGGLIGDAEGGASAYPVIITNDYATGLVTAVGSGWANSGYVGYAGGLVGYANYANVSHCYATGSVVASIPRTAGRPIDVFNTITDNLFQDVGGLVGYINGSISNSYATGNVSGEAAWSVGGLAGYASTITNCWATGTITGYSNLGGLAGGAGTITNSWASGDVTGYQFVGGLAGSSANIISSWASGDVTGTTFVGGLEADGGNVKNSYATGNVKGVTDVGGLMGRLGARNTVTGSYATGKVIGTTNVGGLIGLVDYFANVLSNNYWNVDNQLNAVGGYSKRGTSTNIDNQALTLTQFADIQSYRDGTIDQVIAGRAAVAAEAARQEAFQADASIQSSGIMGQSQQEDAENLPRRKVAEGASGGRQGEDQGSFDDHIVYADSAIYGADIKSISADGVEYNLGDTGAAGPSKDEDDLKKKKK